MTVDTETEAMHDYNPEFLKSLGKLAELYEKEDDFRLFPIPVTSLRRAIIALEGQIITAEEDIKLFNLGDLQGVFPGFGEAILEMFQEFIETGDVILSGLEKLRPATTDQVKWFASLTVVQADHIQTYWGYISSNLEQDSIRQAINARKKFQVEFRVLDEIVITLANTSATTDQREWFASLAMEKAEHIQTWWNYEGI